MRFVVYKHSLVLGDNNIVTKQFIVLKHDDGNLQFTDFHRYVQMMGINAFLTLLSF